MSKRDFQGPRKFLVTGCGRSGTTYTTELLMALGLDVRHETLFGQMRIRAPWVFRNGTSGRHSFGPINWGEHTGEVAWQAVPFLPYLRRRVPVFHQVRAPELYVRSRIAKGFTYGLLRHRHCPIEIEGLTARDMKTAPEELQVRYLALFWSRWNAMARRNARGPYLHLRIEDLDAEVLGEILERIGYSCPEDQVERAFEQVSRRTNAAPGGPERLDWSVLTTAERDEFAVACRREGYAPPF